MGFKNNFVDAYVVVWLCLCVHMCAHVEARDNVQRLLLQLFIVF